MNEEHTHKANTNHGKEQRRGGLGREGGGGGGRGKEGIRTGGKHLHC